MKANSQKFAMDDYGIPKKVNRHVLKVLYYMSERGRKSPDVSEICELVQVTMKNNTIPPSDLPGIVRQSLHNMAKLGVIAKRGSSFYIRNMNAKPVLPKHVSPNIFRMKERQNDSSRLDPNLRRRRHASEDSASGNEIDRARKRFRSSRALSRKGQNVVLPKARMSRKDMNIDLVVKDGVREAANIDQVETRSNYSLDNVFENRFFSEASDNEMDQSQSQDNLSDSSKAGKDTDQGEAEKKIADRSNQKAESKESVHTRRIDSDDESKHSEREETETAKKNDVTDLKEDNEKEQRNEETEKPNSSREQLKPIVLVQQEHL